MLIGLFAGLPDNRFLHEYIPMWRELVDPKDKVTYEKCHCAAHPLSRITCFQVQVTRLLLKTVLDSHSMASVLGRPVGITQAEQVRSLFCIHFVFL